MSRLKPVARVYGYGMSTGYATANGTYATPTGISNSTPCMQCFDAREPSMTTVIYGDTRKGYLPAGSYYFTQEGAVVDANTGFPMSPNSLFATCSGPIYGATMGSCVARASQSSILNYTGSFNPIPSSHSRGCYV